MTPRALSAALLAALLLCSCNSPTDPASEVRPPTRTALAGNWTGAMPSGPVSEDWTSVRLTLDVEGEAVTGWLIPKRGPQHSITAEWFAEAAALRIGDLPSNTSTPCFQITIVVEDVEYRGSQPVALRGHLSGRCPNTLMSRVRFVRE